MNSTAEVGVIRRANSRRCHRTERFTALARKWAQMPIWGCDLSCAKVEVFEIESFGNGKPSGEAHLEDLRIAVVLGQDDELSAAAVLHELAHIAFYRRFGAGSLVGNRQEFGHDARWRSLFASAAAAISGSEVMMPGGQDLYGVKLTEAVAEALRRSKLVTTLPAKAGSFSEHDA